jgi:NAD(P)-dependent dehydrogenase (short-subunit alcohol dehydrogenase family)
MASQQLAPKIGLITGGGRGIGRATALSVADHGHDAIITYVADKAAADQVVAAVAQRGRSAVALRLDTSRVDSFAAFADELRNVLGRWNRESFDFLVNNAGTGLHAGFAETTQAQFDEMVNVHLKGVFFLTQTLLPLIADGGRIVNISSGLTRFSFPGSSAYASVKGAVEVLTRYLAVELGPRKITVNTVAPGAIATDFRGGAVRDSEAMQKQISSVTALGRVGLPDDIGPAIAALLGDQTHWITGQRIEASGGTLL